MKRLWHALSAYQSTRRPLVAIIILFSVSIAAADSVLAATKISPALEKSVLNQEWEEVIRLLSDVDVTSKSPVLRLIKGHALLALNRSNESLELFASALDDDSRQNWQTWADVLVEDYSGKAIAWYFQGDAFARRQQWESAAKSFDRAIEINPSSYLALNARGIVSHAVGNTIMARMYFLKSSKAKTDFADAYASRGTLNVYLNSVEGEDYFNKAKYLSIDQNPVIAELGLGCVSYGRQKHDVALNFFEKVPVTSPLSALARRNELFTNYFAEIENLRLALVKAEELGMSLERRVIRDNDGQMIGILQSKEDRLPDDLPGDWIGIIEVGGYVFIGTLTPLGPVSEDNDDEGNDGTEGDTKESKMTMLPPELLPQPSIIASTTGPGKRGGRGGGITRPPSWRPPTTPGRDRPPPGPQPKPGQRKGLAAGLEQLIEDLNQQLTTQAISDVGGVDATVSKVPANRGKWSVINTYGLLYAIQ